MKFSDFSIGRRLAMGLGVILISTTGAIGYAIVSLNDAARAARQLSSESLIQERAAQEWVSNLTLSGLRNLTTAKFGDPAGANAVFATIDLPDAVGLSKRAQELQKIIAGSLDTAEGRELMEDLTAKRAAYLKQRDIYLKLVDEGKKEEMAKLADTTLREAQKPFVGATKRILEYIRKRITEKDAAMQAQSERTATLLATLSGLVVLLAALMGWALTRGITRPLKQALGVAEKVAAGDLRSKIEATSRDETGALLAAIGTMQENLKSLIGNVRRDVDAVSASASQLAVSADELSGSAAAQNEAVTSTASSVEELTVSISQMSGSAQIAQDVVEATVKISDSGLEMGNKVSREIGEIDRSVSDFAQQMQALQGQAGEIGTVVKLIKEIADQTNLLALNAAIEAARAGEQGRGFAVVADEVRKLAERTSGATSEIQKTIEAIQSNMGSAGNLLDNVKTRVDAGVATIADLIEPLKTLQSQAERAASGLRELTNATKEQQQASEQIARNTEQIAASAEQNQASVSQSRDTSRELSGLAERLTESVTRFQLQ
ncbi:MAG TPA: methyl-accepting chemotaxis protein [Burkholderiales bacterium]|jgi:methyl-accepting chemotaxis protein|nr:methyl-accepting chemotaxis protein [Burkholderiales bacterium]